MASLASYTTLYVTAIGLDGEPDLKHIVAVRWDPGSLDPEESSIADFVRWLDQGAGRAFVRRTDGTRGSLVRVNSDGTRRYLRSHTDDVSKQDELLLLPTWQLTRSSRRHSRSH
ncbi:hypothetical protein [Kribbella sp. C-35]|uniref:hypothetical protein n=1 Tax=Kribbella sp. C-35 TaxID=2789276 RepID=UPI00397A0A33